MFCKAHEVYNIDGYNKSIYQQFLSFQSFHIDRVKRTSSTQNSRPHTHNVYQSQHTVAYENIKKNIKISIYTCV